MVEVWERKEGEWREGVRREFSILLSRVSGRCRISSTTILQISLSSFLFILNPHPSFDHLLNRLLTLSKNCRPSGGVSFQPPPSFLPIKSSPQSEPQLTQTLNNQGRLRILWFLISLILILFIVFYFRNLVLSSSVTNTNNKPINGVSYNSSDRLHEHQQGYSGQQTKRRAKNGQGPTEKKEGMEEDKKGERDSERVLQLLDELI